MGGAEIVSFYKCGGCGAPIPKSRGRTIGGVLVHGNIYVANPGETGGLIGQAFPKSFADPEKTIAAQVHQQAYCVPCFLKALYLTGS